MSEDAGTKARARRQREARWYKWRTFLPIVLTLVAAGCSGGTSTPTQGHIAFASERDGNAEIYVVKDDGTGLTRLTDDPAEDGVPAWSPDGAKVVFASNRDGDFEIYVMNADGTGIRHSRTTRATKVSPPGRRTARGSPSPATATATSRST